MKHLKQYENQEDISEIIEILQEAIDKVVEAREMVDDVILGTSLGDHYEAYGKYGFDQLLGNGNPYDSSLYDLIKQLEEEE